MQQLLLEIFIFEWKTEKENYDKVWQAKRHATRFKDGTCLRYFYSITVRKHFEVFAIKPGFYTKTSFGDENIKREFCLS